MTTVSSASDRVPLLVAGGAVAVSFVVPAAFASALLLATPTPSLGRWTVVAATALLVGVVVLARTALVRHRVAAVLFVVGSAFGFAVAVTSVVVDSTLALTTTVVFSTGYQTLFTVVEVAAVAGAACLVAGAVVVTRRGASRASLRRGLVAVAVVTALPLARDLLIDLGARVHLYGAEMLLALGPWYSPMTLVLSLIGVAAGISIAWPALRAPLRQVRLAVARLHRRYVDSTP